MDFSKEDKEMVGQDLIEQVISLAGVPKDKIKPELNSIIDEMGLDRDKIDLNQIRLVMLSYLEKTNSALSVE